MMEIQDKNRLLPAYVSVTISTRADLIRLIKRENDDIVNPESNPGILGPDQRITTTASNVHILCTNWESFTAPPPLIKAHNHVRLCVLNERHTDLKKGDRT